MIWMATGRVAVTVMLAWLPHVFSDIGELPAPVNVTITSRNCIHLLTWQPGQGTPRAVSYNVSVKSKWNPYWEPVAGCVLVQHPLVCNLTGAFTNPTHVYYTMVVAILRSQASPGALQQDGFKPIKDSELGAPELTVAPCNQSLCVDLLPPLETLRPIYQRFSYQLNITSSTSGQPVQFLKSTRSLNRVVLRDLAPGQEYCVSVSISDSEVPRKSAFSPPQCTSTTLTTTVRTEDVAMSVAFCSVAVLLLAVVFLLKRTGVVGLKNRLPRNLTFTHPLREGRLAVSRKEAVCSRVHIGEMAPSAGGKGTCTPREDYCVGETEEVTTPWSAVGGYDLHSTSSCSSSSSSASSSLSTRPLLAPPLKSEGPSPSHPAGHLVTFSPEGRRSELHSETCAYTTRHVNPLSPTREMEAEAEVRVGPWEGCDQVDLLSLTFGEHGEGWPYMASHPPAAHPEEEKQEDAAMDTVASEEETEEPGGYLSH